MHDWRKSIVLTWSVVCTYAGRWPRPTIYLMTVNISLEEIMHRCTDIFSQCMVWWFSHISMLHYGWLFLVTVVVVLLQFLSSLQAWDITILSRVKDTFPQVNNLVSPCILFLELWPIIHIRETKWTIEQLTIFSRLSMYDRTTTQATGRRLPYWTMATEQEIIFVWP